MDRFPNSINRLTINEYDYKIYFALVDHGIRKNSHKEALGVKKLIKKQNMKLTILTNNKKIKAKILTNSKCVVGGLAVSYTHLTLPTNREV